MKLIAMIFMVALTSRTQPLSAQQIDTIKQIAVVELFTSEGCSSCPAADELLEEMVGLLRNEEKTVIGLAFHVTYWDRLGWKDSFSDEAYSERQKKYAKIFGMTAVYTPQAVLNGEFEFVGSNPVSFRDTFTKVENRKALHTISAVASQNQSNLFIEYTSQKGGQPEWINVAVVQTHAQRKSTAAKTKIARLNITMWCESFKLTT
jgi:hypothetical protein